MSAPAGPAPTERKAEPVRLVELRGPCNHLAGMLEAGHEAGPVLLIKCRLCSHLEGREVIHRFRMETAEQEPE